MSRIKSIKKIPSENYVYDPVCTAPHAYISNRFVSHNCILWLDELEKNLSGSASSNYSDSGTMSRVFGTITTWLQEKKSYVFVVATANDISQLPPELTRKGRMDEIWFVNFPTKSERKEIFEIQIRKYGRDPKDFDLDKLAEIEYKENNKTFKFTGAEIEEAIKDSLYTVFDRDSNGKLITEDIITSMKQLVPIHKSEEDKINKIISECEKHYRAASKNSDKPKMVSKGKVEINI
jgi:SpoVK/Ycf46/Vps4 family AAA+-type ATPase